MNQVRRGVQPPPNRKMRPTDAGEEKLYGTPRRRRQFKALIARLSEPEVRAFWLGFLISDGRVDMADIDSSALPPVGGSVRRSVDKAKALDGQDRRPPRPTGYCHTCGEPLPFQDLTKGGRPRLYCPPPSDCAPSRRLSSVK